MAEVILIAEDDPQITELMKVILDTKGYEVHCAGDGEETVRKAKKLKPDLVVLDVMMPKLNGYEVMHLLKENPSTKDTAVIFLSAKCQTNDKVVGLRMGGQDYISKPFDIYELLARVENALRIRNIPELAAGANRRISESSLADPLTGVYNFTYFKERLQEELERSRRHGYPLGFGLIMADQMDDVRAKFGSLTAGQVIQRLALLLKKSNRLVDVIGRYRDASFVLLMTQTDQGGAQAVCARFRELVRRTRMVPMDPKYKFTVLTACHAFVPDEPATPETVLQTLDQLIATK